MHVHSGIWSSGRRAAVVGVLTVILLLITVGKIGVTWDEPAYMAAAESYNGWFGRLLFGPHGVLHRSVVDSAWDPNHEHPPVDKMISGLAWTLSRNVFDDLVARRMGNILLLGLTVALLYHMIADELGEVAAFGTAAALLAMPRFFFHAHLAALDVPAACMIVIVTYVFWRTKESARLRYTILLGVVAGFAVATKINAAFVLPTLFLWVLLFRRRLYLLIRLGVAALLVLPVFVGVWPWLYYDTVNRIREYIEFQTVSHWEIAQYYLHQVLMPPPWHFPFVMAWAVVPLGTTVLYLAGILRVFFRRRDRAFLCLMLFNTLVPILLLAARQSMVYDNERLFMASFPFLAGLAGAGMAWLANLLRTVFHRLIPFRLATGLSTAAVLLFLAPAVYSTVAMYPHLLSYYSEGVGGLSGAESLGLEVTYWCESYREAVDFINENANPGDTIWVEPWSSDVLEYYQLYGILRDDVMISGSGEYETESVFGPDLVHPKVERSYTQATFVIVQYRQSSLYDGEGKPGALLQWMSSRQPAYRREYEGVPIMEVYWNP
jgi:4-amino-4-deoxy-L-arabinose transferase-like glycosyltransferase